MTIFPAVDIQKGKAVRLRQGRKEDVTVFGDDPVEMAMKWQAQGARWLHVIDLDAAFGDVANLGIIKEICTRLDIPVQVGGGIRNEEIARALLEAGAKRLIIGTVALENPELFRKMCASFPGRIGVSLDADAGQLKSRGWVKDVDLTLEQAVAMLEISGAAFFIYTDISRDGTGQGLNLEAVRKMLSLTKLPVLIAGGVATLEDIQRLAPLRKEGNLQGVVCGRAIYDGSLNLPLALQWLASAGSAQ